MQELKLDLSIKKGIDLVYAKQRDVGSKICIKLTDNEVDYVVPDDVTWSVWYSGASGEGNYDKIDDRDAVVVNGSTATVELIYQMLDNPGPGEMCLVMNSADGTQLGLWNIPYFVEAIPGADSKAATAYYQAFLQAQEKAEAAAERSEAAAERSEAEADRAEAGVGASIIVSLDEGDVATHTAAEIYDAIQNKQTVVYLHYDEFIPLKRANPSKAVFSKTGYPTEFDIFNIEINAQGTVSYETSFSSDLVAQAVEKVEADIAPVSYLPQELKPEQQAQAQMNIGVDKLCPPFAESGSAVTCEPVEGYPLEVVSRIEPVQRGTGDPSPENIRPISGYDKVKLPRCGKNLIPPGAVTLAQTTNVMAWVDTGKILPAGTYTASVNTKCLGVYVVNYATKTNFAYAYNANSLTFTLTEPMAVYLDFYANSLTAENAASAQLELGPTATAYEPYRGETFEINLGQTVYGGTLDWNTGVLTVDRKVVVADGTKNAFATSSSGYWRLPWYTASGTALQTQIVNSHFPALYFATATGGEFVYVKEQYITNEFASADELNAYLVEQNAAGTPLQILYDLEEPITIQLTPQEILALSGINTLYSDTGDTEVTGRANPVAVINNLQSRLAALEAAVVNNA